MIKVFFVNFNKISTLDVGVLSAPHANIEKEAQKLSQRAHSSRIEHIMMLSNSIKGMSSTYNPNMPFPCPYLMNTWMYNPNNMYNAFGDYPYSNYFTPVQGYDYQDEFPVQLKDYGPEPFVVDIEEAAMQNNNFRTALWTGNYLQLTLMSINVGEDIGLEVHPDNDQFIRIEEGQGIVKMGDSRDNLDFERAVYDDFIFIIPAGKWHNLINTGNKPIKLYSIYAPPQHPRGTVHRTKREAEAAEMNHRR